MFTYNIDEEVSLRLLNMGDAEEIYELINRSREYLGKWLPFAHTYRSDGDAKDFIKATLQTFVERGGHPSSVAILYNGQIAGVIGYNVYNTASHYGVIGYWLGEKYQGKGIMTRACKGMIEYGFNHMRLNRVEIHAATDNEKSSAVPTRLGFTEEGIKRQAELLNGEYVDHRIFGLLKDEW